MKRIISCLLILVLMAAAIPASAAAKPARLVLDAPFGVYGEELSVDIRVEDLPECAIFGLTLKYDSSALELIDFEEKQNGEYVYPEDSAKGQYGVVWTNIAKQVQGDVVFGTLKFKIIKKVESTTLKVNMAEAAAETEKLIEIEYGDTVIPLYENHPFTDVGNDWFRESVLFAYNNDLMNGMDEKKFEPQTTCTRAMLVTILYRNAGEPFVIAASPFTDLKQNWYKNPINWAFEYEIVNGMTATTFAPDETVTREQIATILYRYAKYDNANVSQKKSLSSFSDGKKVSSWAKEAMEWAYASGLINGNSINGTVLLDPQGAATRAQIATILMRYVKMTAEQ